MLIVFNVSTCFFGNSSQAVNTSDLKHTAVLRRCTLSTKKPSSSIHINSLSISFFVETQGIHLSLRMKKNKQNRDPSIEGFFLHI